MKDNTNWLLSGGNPKKPVCNFMPQVESIVDVYIDTKCPKQFVKMRLNFGQEEYSEYFLIPLSQLENFEWLDRDIRCRINPDMNPAKAKRYIADDLRQQLQKVSHEKLYRISKLGLHIIDDEAMFNYGGGLIRPLPSSSSRIEFVVVSGSNNLDIDTSLSEDDAIEYVFKLISLYPDAGRIDLAVNALYLMRQLYERVYKSPSVIIYKYGQTGIMKTTTAALMTQLYNRNKGITNPVRLNASVPAAVNILNESNDCVVVFDDLFPAKDREIKRKQEQTLYELTRIIGDNSLPARMKGQKIVLKPVTCGVQITAEYIIGTGSDAARLLPVEMTKPDAEQLKFFQDNPLIVSTFYYYFITWVVENYQGICEVLSKWLSEYRTINIGVHSRLQETHFFLNTAYVILLEYCYEKECITEQDAQALHKAHYRLLDYLVNAQQERVERGSSSRIEQIDFLSPIRTIYQNGGFSLAEEPEHFQNRKDFDGLIHDGCLCLRSDRLTNIFPNYSTTTILEALEMQEALKSGSEKRTIQIHGTKGKRFVAIPLNKLQ